ncbi:MAG: hypothetical protein Ta2D_12430 [Rickettsiales bacterium]|nr:MAG: hypothetical protein Ta2D_12430 [Rickettsiales bacterium]
MNKILVNIICLFIPKKKNRHHFRDKHFKKTVKHLLLEQDINNKIESEKHIEMLKNEIETIKETSEIKINDIKINNVNFISNLKKEEGFFDIVVACKSSGLNNFFNIIPYIFKNIVFRNLIIITKYHEEYFEKLSKIKYIKMLDEDKILDNLTINNVKNIMTKISGNDGHSGWYFQQFLKMGYSYICKDEYYLIWDADLLPLNKLDFFKNKKPILNVQYEYHHPPYFQTLKKILEIETDIKDCFVVEHGFFNKNIMIELLEKIKNNNNLKGENFWEKILYAIDIEHLKKSGFSEYETFAYYVLKYHKDEYLVGHLRKFNGNRFFQNFFEPQILNKIANDFDIMNFDLGKKELNITLLEHYFNEVIREEAISEKNMI